MKKIQKNEGKPYYDRKKDKWKLDVAGIGTEMGDLTYIACEYVQTSLYYPFHYGKTREDGFVAHSHNFSELLEFVMDDPEHFSVKGFEQYYSPQEIELIYAFQKKLIGCENSSRRGQSALDSL